MAATDEDGRMSSPDTELGEDSMHDDARPESADTVDMDLDDREVLKLLPLYGVPEDCFVHVLRFLSAEQLCLLARASKDFKKLTGADQFWQKLCVQDYGADTETLTEAYSHLVNTGMPMYWKRMYKELMNYRIKLHFTAGPRSGDDQRVPFDGPCMLGRSRQNDVCILHDEMVSRKHAKIVRKDRHYWIHDVGGINRTFINKRVIKQYNDHRL